jgi:hypothetical protein
MRRTSSRLTGASSRSASPPFAPSARHATDTAPGRGAVAGRSGRSDSRPARRSGAAIGPHFIAGSLGTTRPASLLQVLHPGWSGQARGTVRGGVGRTCFITTDAAPVRSGVSRCRACVEPGPSGATAKASSEERPLRIVATARTDRRSAGSPMTDHAGGPACRPSHRLSAVLSRGVGRPDRHRASPGALAGIASASS